MTASVHSQDPESLLPAGSRRACPCRSLDWFLLLALCALGAAFLWFALCSPWSVLAGPSGTPETRSAALNAGGDAAVQMLPNNILTHTRQMGWDSNSAVDGVVFSTNFNYHKDSHELEVKVGGLYFIYAQLAVRCTASKCNKTKTINLYIHQKSGNTDTVVLTVSLHLSSKSEDNVSKFSAALRPLNEGDFLYAELKALDEKVDDEDWLLEQVNEKKNFFGLFRLSSESEAQQLGA